MLTAALVIGIVALIGWIIEYDRRQRIKSNTNFLEESIDSDEDGVSIDSDEVKVMMSKSDEMIEIDPYLPDPYKYKGLLMFKNYEYNLAIIHFNKYFYFYKKKNDGEFPKDYRQFILKRGICNYHLGNHEESFKDLEQVQDLFDNQTKNIFEEIKSYQ